MAEAPLVDAVLCVREFNPRGLPSRHGELFKGKPLLHHVVSRLRDIPGLRDVAILCDRIDPVIEAARDLWGARIHDSTLLDIPRRPRFRKARLWSSRGWRGGLDYTSAFDEDGWPQALLAVHEAHPCDLLYLVGAEWPCLDPTLSRHMIDYALQVGSSALTVFHQGSPGLLGQTYSRNILEQLASRDMSLRDALAVTGRGKDNSDEQKSAGNFDLPPTLTRHEYRFTADTPRAARWLETLDPTDPLSAIDWVNAARQAPPPKGPPEEIEWEWAGPEDDQLLQEDLFRSVSDEILDEPDSLVTLDGRGDWLLHPHWRTWVDSLKTRRLHGLHLRCRPDHLDAPTLEALFASRADVLSFILDDRPDDDDLAALIKRGCQARDPVTGPLVVVELARTRQLIPRWEAFWDRWFGVVDHVLWRYPGTHSDHAHDQATLLLNRGQRHPCRRLSRELQLRWNGIVPLCREDCADQHVVGRFPDMTLGRAREQLDIRWIRHRDGLYETPCDTCDAWDRLTP